MDESQTPESNNTSPQSASPAAPTVASTETPKAEGRGIEFTETTIMAALSYISILVFIPFLTKKDNPFILFHVRQGLVVFGLGLVFWVIGHMFWMVGNFLQLVVLVLSIIGIINALKQQEKKLPFIGNFADHIKI